MAKWCASIFFIVLFFTASAHTVNRDATRLCTKNYQSFFNEDAGERLSHFAMPSAGITGIAHHQQAQQRTSTGDDFTTSYNAAFFTTATCIAAGQIDMFGNTLLSHNYHAHNFW